MKHTLIYLFAVLTLLSAIGCSRQEESLFEQSATERLQAQQDSVRSNLLSATNGWELLYFPHPDAAGYAFLMRFQGDGSVTIAAKNAISSNSVYTEETSCWSTDGTQGCTLTFNTYNSLFSIFSDPLDDGLGYYGDFEFIVLNTSDKQRLNLKGKKHGAYLSLNRLPDDQGWEDYFAKIDNYYTEVFNDNDGIDMFFWDGKSQMQMVYENGMYKYTVNDEEQERGFVVSPTGVHFYSGFLMADSVTRVKDFVLAEDKQTLKSESGEAFIGTHYTAADFFAYKFTKYSKWIYTDEGSDSKTQTSLQSIRELAQANGAELYQIAYERIASLDSRGRRTYSYALHVTYLVDNKLFGGRINLAYVNKDGVIKLTYSDYEASLAPLFARIASTPEDGLKLFTDAFCGTFAPRSYTGSGLNMTQLLLEREDGASLHVIADKIIM